MQEASASINKFGEEALGRLADFQRVWELQEADHTQGLHNLEEQLIGIRGAWDEHWAKQGSRQETLQKDVQECSIRQEQDFGILEQRTSELQAASNFRTTDLDMNEMRHAVEERTLQKVSQMLSEQSREITQLKRWVNQ